MFNLFKDIIFYVLNTLVHDSVPLAFGIIVATILNVYVEPEKFKAILLKRKKVSILGSVAFGAFTPLCSCGTMAVIISMLTTVLPWGPIMAFITSSPLMSPDMFIMLSGIISVKFAIALTLCSVIIGITAGYISHYLEKNTKFFDDQVRFSKSQISQENNNDLACCISSESKIASKFKISKPIKNSCCSENITAKVKISKKCCEDSNTMNIKEEDSFIKKYKLNKLLSVLINLGLKQILLYFSAFAAIGYLINRFVPSSLIMSLFGTNNIFSVPLAALIGIPLYVSDASTIPLIKTLMDAGGSGGAVLAFMITGPGTSVGAIVGSLTIMKKKAVLLYVSILFISAIVLGYLYNFLLLSGL